jgi:hypothetical protein
MDEMQADDLAFSVDRVHLDEVELRVRRAGSQTWCWQVLYIGAVQVMGYSLDGENDAWNRARRHRDLWIEQELEAIKRATDGSA